VRALFALGSLTAAALVASPARASPEWNGGIVTSLCALGERGAYFEELAWRNELRVDVLFGRTRNAGFAAGPYVDLSTRDFDDLRWGGGASLLVPIAEDFPLVVSVGPYLNGIENAGVQTSLFWGLRAYNFHSAYGMAGGLVLGAEHDLGTRRETSLFVGARLDALWLALPLLIAYEWIRGG
jgi:hypothetical protein